MRRVIFMAASGLLLGLGVLCFAWASSPSFSVRVPHVPHVLDRVHRPDALKTETLRAAPASTVGAAAATDAAPLGHVRYLLIGGGPTPESSEVSLEQDIALALTTLSGPSGVLFAGGVDTASVRTLDPSLDADSVLVRVGELFQPRAGRTSRYRKPSFSSVTALPATRPRVEQELGRALADGDEPLLVYIAAHGEQGENAADNQVVLWGGDVLSVPGIAALQDEQPGAQRRQLRLVIASCFAGGFAELAFDAADERAGFARAPRCGLFAGTWDRETSGCDPNPDRRAQESYSMHVLHALRGEDREGRALPAAQIDFDADGKISLLEAHTRSRIASSSVDVPTTTSERYLRSVEKAGGKLDLALLPEDAAVIAQLGARLDLRTRAAAQARWQALDQQLDELDATFSKAEAELDAARAVLSARLLGRWPVLDDAYHPDFSRMLATESSAIAHELDASDAARAYAVATARVNELDAAYREMQTLEAEVTRLLRAHETVQLATALAKRGGSAWENYQTLLKCERTLP